MYRLDHQDSRLILSALEELNSDVDPASLPRRALSFLDAVVDHEISNFDFFSPEGRYDLTAWTNRPDIPESEVFDNFKRFYHQHPTIPLSIADCNGNPLRITDAATQTDFERTELYNEFFRKIEINHQMGLGMSVSTDLIVCCAVARGGRDFSERDRTMLALAAPHLLNSLRGAIAYNRLNSALETAETGVIAIDSNGQATFVSEFARGVLDRYFIGEKPDSGLPRALGDWLRTLSDRAIAGDLGPPPPPLKIENELGSVTIRYLENSLSRERTLLLEERLAPTPAVFEGLDLTRRESEILYWMTNGKSDGDISTLCDISIRTVHKHVEHVYQKLGVETRTAAMLRALELI